MDEITAVAHTGLLIPGHDLPPASAAEAAAGWLASRGVDEWGVYSARPDMRPACAWWGGDGVGFVGRDHPAASPVIVVHLPERLLTQSTVSVPARRSTS